MRVLAWNIQCGGGKRRNEIVQAIQRHAPDVVVLTEYRSRGSASLLHEMADHGLVHQSVTAPPERIGGVAILSKQPLSPCETPTALKKFDWRYLRTRIAAFNLEVVGLYGPLHKEPHGEFWAASLDALGEVSGASVLVAGDFNTCESLVDTPVKNFFCSQFFCALPQRGYTDLWRHLAGREARDYSWQGEVNKFRLDHAFGTAAVVSRLRTCRYSHDERLARVSDHSLLTIDLAEAQSFENERHDPS